MFFFDKNAPKLKSVMFVLTENPGLEKQDTFVEKLVTQVIKNLQIKIANIHVRYEDDVSPFPFLMFVLEKHFEFRVLTESRIFTHHFGRSLMPCVYISNISLLV